MTRDIDVTTAAGYAYYDEELRLVAVADLYQQNPQLARLWLVGTDVRQPHIVTLPDGTHERVFRICGGDAEEPPLLTVMPLYQSDLRQLAMAELVLDLMLQALEEGTAADIAPQIFEAQRQLLVGSHGPYPESVFQPPAKLVGQNA